METPLMSRFADAVCIRVGSSRYDYSSAMNMVIIKWQSSKTCSYDEARRLLCIHADVVCAATNAVCVGACTVCVDAT